MKGKRLFILITAMILLVLFSGCTTTDSSPIKTETSAAAMPTPVSSVISEPFIIKMENIPEEITVTSDSKPVNKNSAILIYYTLDSTETNSYANQNGWKIIVTAFAYNTANVPKDFNPASSGEIRDSGIPYQSRSIHVYPNNVYSDSIEISDSPSGQVIDANKPYNYGIIFTLQ